MANTRRASLAFFLCVFPAISADSGRWGKSDNGLRITASMGKPGSTELLVTFENVGTKEILIPVGVKAGAPHLIFFTLYLITANGANPKVTYTGLGAIGGAVEPLTMGLRTGETYTVSLATDRYYVLEASERLTAFLKRGQCRIWVQLEVKADQWPNPATLDLLRRKLPCWHGKVASNVLQL